MLAASVSEVVRKTIDSCGTFRFSSSLKAFSALSRESNTPIAVSIWASPCANFINGCLRGQLGEISKMRGLSWCPPTNERERSLARWSGENLLLYV
jgi:hypothetical protein